MKLLSLKKFKYLTLHCFGATGLSLKVALTRFTHLLNKVLSKTSAFSNLDFSFCLNLSLSMLCFEQTGGSSCGWTQFLLRAKAKSLLRSR